MIKGLFSFFGGLLRLKVGINYFKLTILYFINFFFLLYFFLLIKLCKRKGVEIWCLILYLFHRLGKFTLIVPCYFGYNFINLRYKITLSSLFYRAY